MRSGETVAPPFPPIASRRSLRRAEVLIASGDIVALAACALAGGPDVRPWVVALVLALALLGTNCHRLRRNLSALNDAPWLVRRLAVAALLTSPLVATTDNRLLVTLLLAPFAVLTGRAITYAVLRQRRSRGRLVELTLVVGGGDISRTIVDAIERDRRYGLWVVGVIDDVEPDASSSSTDHGLDDLPALVEALGVRHVIVSPCVGHGATRGPALRSTIERGVDVHVVPRMGEVLPQPSSSEVDVVAGFALHRVAPPVPSGPRWWMKRMIDVVCSIVIVLLTIPVLVTAAIGVRLTSPGPILFRQQRIGRNGEPFTMLKFRTFPVDHVDTVFSLPTDACPIPFGRLLRRTSIDELPQLLNVLKGDMSLVGPRPERPHFAEPLSESLPGYKDRHRVRGGITGLAQVHGYWGDSDITERIRLDNRYVDSWSLWRDFVIMVQTVSASVRKYKH